MRKRADKLGPGDTILCKGPADDGSETAWYRVESVETEGSYVYVLGSSDVCDDDLPMMLQGAQMVETT